VCILPDNLRSDAKELDGFASSPLFDLIAETFSNPETTHLVPNDKSPDDDALRRLQVPLNGGVDPSYEPAIENSA
jgi:hypothetical protein